MGNILVVAIIRELGPIFTALVVVARSGTAVATEIGNMQVNHEIEALRAMSIDPLSYVVAPRIVGGIISIVCLAFYFNSIALIGGYFVASQLKQLSLSFYLEVLAQAIDANDFFLSLFKNSLSGMIIFLIATYHGFKVKGAPHEVPIASTKAVVDSIMSVVAFNLGISLYIYWKALA
jgi:phospholipid/cholesterol/gamma-HCH transport system permease protein